MGQLGFAGEPRDGFGHLVNFQSCWGCRGRMWRGDAARHQLLVFLEAVKHQSGTYSLCQLQAYGVVHGLGQTEDDQSLVGVL